MDIEKLLKENKNRVTPERIAIFNFLKSKHIFTYNDIINDFKSIWRASVFRTLNLFLEISLIRKIDVWENAVTYELDDKEHHHEHMKCSICNSVINFTSDDICKKIFTEAKKMGFKIKSHNIWIVGTCKNCL